MGGNPRCPLPQREDADLSQWRRNCETRLALFEKQHVHVASSSLKPASLVRAGDKGSQFYVIAAGEARLVLCMLVDVQSFVRDCRMEHSCGSNMSMPLEGGRADQRSPPAILDRVISGSHQNFAHLRLRQSGGGGVGGSHFIGCELVVAAEETVATQGSCLELLGGLFLLLAVGLLCSCLCWYCCHRPPAKEIAEVVLPSGFRVSYHGPDTWGTCRLHQRGASR